MNSNKTKPQKSSSAAYKFLPRSLKIGNQDEAAYRICYVKRFFFKRLRDSRDEDLYRTDYRLISRLSKNSKYLKTLRSSQISSFLQPSLLDKLKMSQNLIHYSFSFESEADITERIVFYLKRLPSPIQTIHLEIFRSASIPDADFYNIAKSLRRSHKLQTFSRSHYIDSDNHENMVPRELRIYSQSVSRLKDLNQMSYNVNADDQPGFQRAMRRGFVYPGITGLKISLNPHALPHFHQTELFFEPEEPEQDIDFSFSFDLKNMTGGQKRVYRRIQDDIRREDEEKNDAFGGGILEIVNEENPESDANSVADPKILLDDEAFVARCTMMEEMKPFYRFELFPNLKELTLMQNKHIGPLGNFVVEGFKKLKNLESLEISFWERPEGTKYLFKAFLHLPLLKKFSLFVHFLQTSDWIQLEKFLKDQNHLKGLSLRTRAGLPTYMHYSVQNDYLEKVIKGLNEKPMLKSLDLRSPFWSLEALSKGFSHLTMMNQLHTFKFEGSDETITSDQKLTKRVEGLSKFIKNQKGSLKELHVNFALALDDKMVIHLAEAFSKLTQLTDLVLDLHYTSAFATRILIPYYEETLQGWRSHADWKKLPSYEKWNPSIGKYLKRLENLENFTLNCGILNPTKKDSAKWFGEVLKALPSLERLGTIKIVAFENEALKNEEKTISTALRELKNIKQMNLEFYNDFGQFTSSQSKLDRVVIEVQAKQARRTDLMF